MGGLHSTPAIEQHVHEELQSKYNRMRGNYETEKLVSQSLKENIEKLEKKIVELEISLETENKINNDNNKIIESLKSNYESDSINKENKIMELEDLLMKKKEILENNEKIVIKNEQIIEELRNKNLKLSYESKNIKFLENKYKILEDSCITQEKTIDELKFNLNIKNDTINEKQEEIDKMLTYEAKLIEMQNDNSELKKIIKIQEDNQDILNKKICSVVNTLDYFKKNKTEIIEDILKTNNTLLPDFMEKNIIQNIYSYIINKLDLLITV